MRTLLTRSELAEELSLLPALVKKLALQRKIPVLRLGHRTVRYDLVEVKAAIDRYEIRGVR